MSRRFHPDRVDHFKKWAERIIAAARTPDNVDYLKTTSAKKPSKGGTTKGVRRRKRFLRRKRRKQE